MGVSLSPVISTIGLSDVSLITLSSSKTTIGTVIESKQSSDKNESHIKMHL